MPGFVAVIVPEESDATEQIISGVFGTVASEARPDMLHYSQMAAATAEHTGRAVLVACMPADEYRMCLVFRRGRSPHSFGDARSGPDQHFAGVHHSCVADPLADGLALAGFDSSVAVELCWQLGKHSHAG